MQSLNPDPKAHYTSVYGALKKIIRTEGFWRPLRGLNVMMMGAGPAHAMYFACYENMKRTLNAVFHPLMQLKKFHDIPVSLERNMEFPSTT